MAKSSVKRRPMKPVMKVNRTLETKVVDILARLVPEVAQFSRKQALVRILDDMGLLARCFMAYRDHPEEFRHLMVTRDQEFVQTADEPMVCERSFDDVVGIIVRTAAKRYFRRQIDGETNQPLHPGKYLSKEELGALQRLMSAFGRTYKRTKPSTPGRRLYDAMSDFISQEWQVPLMPEYAAMPLPVVKSLGATILDYTQPDEVRQLRADPANPPPPSGFVPPPLFVPPPPPEMPEETEYLDDGEAGALTGAGGWGKEPELVAVPTANTSSDKRARLEDILSADGKRIKSSAFSMVMLEPQVRAVLPDTGAAVRINSVLGMVGAGAAKMLVGSLGLRTDQLAVMVMWSHHSMGEQAFLGVFGTSGKMEAVDRIIDRCRAAGVDQDTPLPEIVALVQRGFVPKPGTVSAPT